MPCEAAAMNWASVIGPVAALLGVGLGYVLSAWARYAAVNEQHARTRVEAARENFLATHLTAYNIANRLRLDDGQDLADLWTAELARQIEDLRSQLYDQEFFLTGRGGPVCRRASRRSER